MFYHTPEYNHFIDRILRAPARVSSRALSSEQILSRIPSSFSGQLFMALVYGLWTGFTSGAGVGMLGRYILGRHPKL